MSRKDNGLSVLQFLVWLPVYLAIVAACAGCAWLQKLLTGL